MREGSLRTWLLVAAIGGATGCVTPGAVKAGSAADEWLGVDREARFQAYRRDLEDGTIVSARGLTRLGTSWVEGWTRAHARFLAAQSKEDVYLALLSLKNAVHDGHADLQVPAGLRPAQRQWRLPFELRWAWRDGASVLEVATTPGQGVEPGLRLLRVDGRPVAELLHEYLEWHRDGSPERAQQAFARWLTAREAWRHPAPDARPVKFVFLDPARGVEVAREAAFASGPPPPNGRPSDVDYAGLTPVFRGLNVEVFEDAPSRTLVVRYLSFSYQFETEELWNRVAVLSWPVRPLEPAPRSGGSRLQALDVEHLGAYLRTRQGEFSRVLVDVRDNPGGGVNLPLLRLLATKPFRTTTRGVAARPLLTRDPEFREAALSMSASPAMIAQLKKDLDSGAAETSRFSFDCRSEACPGSEANAEPDPQHLTLPVVVLSGPACISSCDQFVAVVADNGLGKLVGLPSAGASAPFRAPRKFTLANGQTFSITLNVGLTWRPNGDALEGNPAQPDLVFPLGRGALREVLDALAAAR